MMEEREKKKKLLQKICLKYNMNILENATLKGEIMKLCDELDVYDSVALQMGWK